VNRRFLNDYKNLSVGDQKENHNRLPWRHNQESIELNNKQKVAMQSELCRIVRVFL